MSLENLANEALRHFYHNRGQSLNFGGDNAKDSKYTGETPGHFRKVLRLEMGLNRLHDSVGEILTNSRLGPSIADGRSRDVYSVATVQKLGLKCC